MKPLKDQEGSGGTVMSMPGRLRWGYFYTMVVLFLGYAIPVRGQAPAPGPPQVPAAMPSPPPAPEPDENGGFAGRDSSVGYIDNAAPLSQMVLRYDGGFDFDFPNRAEFFYAKGGPTGNGVPLAERRIDDFQHLSFYLETAWTPRFSSFLEVPIRFSNPVINDNYAGLSDINAGFKYALVNSEAGLLSFQLRTYAPTGAARRGLGTKHTSLEPALLAFAPVTDRLGLVGELRYWLPIGGTEFAGDVFRYGAGFRYDLVRTCSFQFSPVVEMVGWTVLSGLESQRVSPTFVFVDNARGTNIINAKLGARFTFGECTDLYVGYGRALTGERWYEDIARVEFRILY